MLFIDRLRSGWKQFRNERLYRRIRAEIPVTIHSAEIPAPRCETIRNWSPGGLFIETPDVLPLEALLDVEFCLGQGGGSMLKLRAQVVRHQLSPAHGTKGMGLMFTDFSQSGLLILRDLLTKAYADVTPT